MDRELLLRARAGDMEAFETIVLAKAEPLYRTATAILGNEADAGFDSRRPLAELT